MKFAIVTPSLNPGRYLMEALHSVTSQAGDFSIHYHVQDGLSTDGTVQALEGQATELANGAAEIHCREFSFSYSSEPDNGMYDAINRGFRAILARVEPDVMLWINADDCLAAGALAALHDHFHHHPECHWLIGRTIHLDDDSNVIVDVPPVLYHQKDLRRGRHDGLLLPFVTQEATAWRCGVWRDCGELSPTLRYAGDFEFWIRLAGRYQLTSVNLAIGKHRKRKGQLSASPRYGEECRALLLAMGICQNYGGGDASSCATITTRTEISMECANLASGGGARAGVLSDLTRLIELARGGQQQEARELMAGLERRLHDFEPEFRDRQHRLLGQIGSTYKLRQDGACGTREIAPVAHPIASQAEKSFHLLEWDQGDPKPGISLVVGCMNREENLLKVLPTWLATEANEIVIIDWSSKEPVWPKIRQFDDPRIMVIRIEGEPRWVLSHALNVGLRFASYETVFKVDCDIALTPGFFSANSFALGEFARGFWRAGLDQGGEGQQYINGTFGAFKQDLRAINYYDERILSYGWDDSDLYLRLSHDHGLAGRLIEPRSLRHLEQRQEQRLENQQVIRNRFLDRFEPTEFEGGRNKFYGLLTSNWGTWNAPQDYQVTRTGQRTYLGQRTTQVPMRAPEFERLAEVMAAKQMALWTIATVPELAPIYDFPLEFAQLLRDCHLLGRSGQLIKAIKESANIHFIHCDQEPLRAALLRSLEILHKHIPTFDNHLFIVEGAADLLAPANPRATAGVLVAEGRLISTLVQRCQPVEVDGIEALERLLEAGEGTATHMAISIESLVDNITRKGARFAAELGEQFSSLPAPLERSCLVTSLYDEQNLIRLVEYVACIVENLRVFERTIVYYEAGNGVLSSLLQSIAATLAVPPGRLLVVPYPKRPTFAELFSAQSLLPEGTTLAVANADIVFDGTLAKIRQLDLSKTVVVLSRRDVSADGKQARLIRLENGSPNTFSEDAWIAKTPFEPDFYLDYFIGTMFCDSFINNQLSRSSRYTVINPCLEIKVFHLHDERFNSSAEKAKRDFEQMKVAYANERARNDDTDPVKGVAWCSLNSGSIIPSLLRAQPWRPKVLICDLAAAPGPVFGQLLITHQILSTPGLPSDISIVLRAREHDALGTLGTLLARYQAHFAFNNLLLDIKDGTDDGPIPEGTVLRNIAFGDMADWIVDGERYYQEIYSLVAWPDVAGAKFLRCNVDGALSAANTAKLFATLLEPPQFKESWLAFFDSLPDYSPEKNLLTPFMAPILVAGPTAPLLRLKAEQPNVALVTSLFRGGAYLPGYLENACAAALEAGGEVIIVDANSDDADADVIADFLRAHPEAREVVDYSRVAEDPGLYACWRIAIERSRAELITNANIDDRRCPYHTARLAALLHEHPEYAAACGSISAITDEAIGDWYRLVDNQVWFYREGMRELCFENLYRRNEHGDILSRNVMHCMPVWRKNLHARYGFFDEAQYGTSADWAFWLKCAKAGERFAFDDGAFGRYFINPSSHNRRNDADGVKEKRIIHDFIGIEQQAFVQQ